jgi:integrase
MAILAECPICRNRQKVSNKICKCGQDLDKAKRSSRVKYWISYRLPNGKQRREVVGYSIEDARAAEGKRMAQKREAPRVLEIDSDSKTKFKALSEWYLLRPRLKKLASYSRIVWCMEKFNSVFGDWYVSDFRLADLEDYVELRKDEGLALSTIDLELSTIKQMIRAAFNNDKISGHVLKIFTRLDKFFTSGSNARTRTISFDEYVRLLNAAQDFLKPILVIGMNTGMRVESEILGLKWNHIDRKTGFIRFKAEDTKEKKPKNIPINHNVADLLDRIVPHVHHPFIFTCNHQPIIKLSHFVTCCKRAALPCGYKTEGGIVFRDIRRTVKTNMVAAGIDEVYRDTLLGHSKKGMDVHYIHPDEETLTTAMDKYTAWLDSKLADVDHTVDQGIKNQSI